jgi:hypothetical protein
MFIYKMRAQRCCDHYCSRCVWRYDVFVAPCSRPKEHGGTYSQRLVYFDASVDLSREPQARVEANAATQHEHA